MNNLIKDGKFFTLETSTLIAVTTWFTHYDEQRRKLYKSAKGVFFEVKEIPIRYKDRQPNSPRLSESYKMGYFNDCAIRETTIGRILTENNVREIYEYTMTGGEYGTGSYNGIMKYKFEVDYEKLFELVEG